MTSPRPCPAGPFCSEHYGRFPACHSYLYLFCSFLRRDREDTDRCRRETPSRDERTERWTVELSRDGYNNPERRPNCWWGPSKTDEVVGKAADYVRVHAGGALRKHTWADLTNMVFSRLTALEVVGKSAEGSALWRCRCECGQHSNVRAAYLRNGATKSCGCLRRDRARETMRARNLSKAARVQTARSRLEMSAIVIGSCLLDGVDPDWDAQQEHEASAVAYVKALRGQNEVLP